MISTNCTYGEWRQIVSMNCDKCGEECESDCCSRCKGEGGSRSGSDDDGNAWSHCEYCSDGCNYKCQNEICEKYDKEIFEVNE